MPDALSILEAVGKPNAMPRPDLCLEFVNTRYWRGQPTPTESLNGPDDLAAWLATQGAKDGRPLSRREFEQALEVRETIHRVFDATARGKPAAAGDLQALNERLAAAPARQAVRRDRSGYAWEVDPRTATAEGALAAVLWSAGDLLTGGLLDKVRRCANPDCGWLFFDDSRAGKRRWCSMASCGNRAKAKRHYHRTREG